MRLAARALAVCGFAFVGSTPAAPASAAAPGAPEPPAAVVLGAREATSVRSLACASGHPLARFALPAPASASLALAPDGQSAYVAVHGARLLRLKVPALAPAAQATLRFDATSVAVAGGPEAIVLAAGAGNVLASAHDPVTLAAVYEFRLPDDARASVSAIVDRPGRSRFALAFSDLDEAWEIAYDRNAPPVLAGLVHDYRMREAIELPGRFTPRRFALPNATRALVGGSTPAEVLRIDAADAIGVLQLDVRREIERPAIAQPPPAHRIAAWHAAHGRGWALADPGARALRVLQAGAWRLVDPVALDGEVLAIAADDGPLLLALAQPERIALVRLDVETRHARTLASVPRAGSAPYRFARGTQGCLALVDANENWIAGLTRGMRAAAPGRGS